MRGAANSRRTRSVAARIGNARLTTPITGKIRLSNPAMPSYP